MLLFTMVDQLLLLSDVVLEAVAFSCSLFWKVSSKNQLKRKLEENVFWL